MYWVYWRLSVSLSRFHSVVNSQKAKVLSWRGVSPVLVTLSRQYSNSASSGMKYVLSVRMPEYSLVITA